MNDYSVGVISKVLHGVPRHVVGFVLVFVAIGSITYCRAGTVGESADTNKWVGTWSTAPQLVETGNNPPAPGLSNNTLRQIVRVSIGGDTLRLQISNEFSTSPVTLHAVHIALSKGGGAIDSTTDRILSFGGNTETSIAPGTVVVSDPFPFRVPSRTDLAITIYYGTSPTGITGHPGSRTTSYILSGNAAANVSFAGAVTTDHWYNINAIDVVAPSTAACVAILGNSITDGRGSTTNAQNRWPDVFSESLLQDSSTRGIAVINSGIGGNCVLAGGLGPTGVSRFDRDIINKPGVRWVIVFEGVNDIGGVNSANAATTMSANLITAYQQMVSKAHAKSLKIYGATIMPFNGNGYYNQYSELCRSTVNQWIRQKGNFDGCIDFDKLMRNPADTTRLVSSYQNDGLHPDVAGHKKMGDSVDHHLFYGDISSGVHEQGELVPKHFRLEQNYPNPFNPTTAVSYQLSAASKAKIAIYDLLGREIAVLVNETEGPGRYVVQWDASGISSGMYVYRLTSGGFTEARKMMVVR